MKLKRVLTDVAVGLSAAVVIAINAQAGYYADKFAGSSDISNGKAITTNEKSTWYKYTPTSSEVTFTITSENEETGLYILNADETEFQWVELEWGYNPTTNFTEIISSVEKVKCNIIEGELDTRKGGWGVFSDKSTKRAVFTLTIKTEIGQDFYMNVYASNKDTDKIGTVTVSSVKDVDSSTSSHTTVKGDANNDGKVTLTDALLVLKHANGSDKVKNSAMADYDGNGKVTMTDALRILKLANNI
ncbi:MAG: dockerin type I repeat-containing protein [Oscillospiraceae bacterium]|nr:dockerin type I repeat-containing protein [Oscillospiraceae bacterium]